MKKTLFFLSLLLTIFCFSVYAQSVTIYSEGFEGGDLPAGWLSIDADNDGHTWMHSSLTYVNPYTGEGSVASFSRISGGMIGGGTPLTPDNWLISSGIPLSGSCTLHFWRTVGFQQPAEHYGIYVSTTSQTDLSSFTQVFQETVSSDNKQWTERTVDLGDYTGTVYIAFRHYDCTNQFALVLDDISITSIPSASIISASPTVVQFPNVPAGVPTAAQSVTVHSYDVTNVITVTADSPFEISLDNLNYNHNVSMSDTDSLLYVRYYPTTIGTDTAMLTFTDGSTSTEVLLVGSSLECTFTLPYAQNFNSVPQNELPDCWTRISPFDGYPKASSYYESEIDNKFLMFRCNVNTHEANYAVMPPMPTNLSELQILFTTFREDQGSGTLSVGYVTSPGDSSSFVPIWSINGQQIGDNAPHQYAVSFENLDIDPDTSYFITFKYEANGNLDRFWFVDDITVDYHPACAMPTDLTLLQVNSTSARVNWTGNLDYYNLYYKTTYDTAWTELSFIAADTAGYLIENLLPITEYLWYVASICEDGTFVNSLGTGTFTTTYIPTSCTSPSALAVTDVAHSSVTLDWTENGSATSWNIQYGPAGFPLGSPSGTIVAADTTPFTINGLSLISYDFYVQSDCGAEQSLWIGPVNAHPGHFNFGIEGSDTITTCEATLFDNGGATGNYSSDCDYTLVIYPETDDSYIVVTGSYNTESNWDHLYLYDGIDVDGPELGHFSGNGTIPYIAATNGPMTIHFVTDEGIQKSGFELTVTCTSCSSPGNLTVDNITSTSADLSWTGKINSYVVEYKAESDTVWTTEFLTDSTLLLSGLTPATTYLVNIYSNCDSLYSPAVTTTFFTPMVAAELPYSTDFSDSQDQQWLLNNGTCANHWMIGSLDNEDKALFISANSSTPGYNSESFSVVTAEKAFVVGTVSDVIISFDVKAGGENEFDFLKVFFAPADTNYPAAHTTVPYASADFMQYAVDFSEYLDSTECTFEYTFCMTGDSTIHVTAVMPNPIANPDAASVAKLVFLWRNDNNQGNQPGAIIDNLSVEATPCQAPTDLRETGIIFDKLPGILSVEWTDNADATRWNLQYRRQGTQVWNTVVVEGAPTYTIQSGLVGGTAYELRVQAVCDEETASDWSNTLISVAHIVGINEHLSGCVTLYPNPANDHVDIRVKGDVNVTGMDIYDVYGKLIRTVETVHAPSLQTRINISGLANGMYFVRVNTDKGVVTKPFVKK